MKNIQNKLIPLLFLTLAFSPLCSTQEDSTPELSYEVNSVYPPLSITKNQLMEAQTLLDLNAHYEASWVKEYISVEILTHHKGKIKKVFGQNETLNEEQKNLMKRADVGTDISVKVEYLPKNTLTHNDRQEIHFTFIVNPEKEASYPDGEQALKQYLKEQAMDQIPAGSFQGYALTAVTFTISEEGEIMDPQLFWASENEKVDELLVETVCNMPNWKPAEYANGLKVKQEMVLMVGNMENCTVHTLNIRREEVVGK